MDLRVLKTNKYKHELKLPSSKAVFHRLFIKTLIKGEKRSFRVNDLGEDLKSTLSFISSLNSEVIYRKNKVTIIPHKLYLKEELNAFNSASTLRFFLPLLLHEFKSLHISCSEKLKERILKVGFPYENLVVTSTKTGLFFDGTKSEILDNFPALTSQFFSGFLFLDYYLKRKSLLKSYDPYVLLTKEVLNSTTVNQEPCMSHLGLCLPVLINSSVYVKGNFKELLQGDKEILNFFLMIGGKIKAVGKKNFFVLDSPDDFVFDTTCNPDLFFPVLYFIHKYHKGRILITEKLKYKESNRIEAGVNFFKALGSEFNIDDHFIMFKKTRENKEDNLETYGDHRLAILSLFLAPHIGKDYTIKNFDCAFKSSQNLLKYFRKIGGKYEEIN